MINVISLGAGVQSSTMALMAAQGVIRPMPDAAVFADTQDEPASVYRWLEWLRKQLPFEVHTVTAGRLRDAALKMRVTKDGRRFSTTNIPFFTLSETGQEGKINMRSCTYDYKIKPIIQFVRKFAKVKRGQKEVSVRQWLGISLDEIQRMKPSRELWHEHRWPLIEMRYTRAMCLQWMSERGYPTPPRSSCVYCPYHSDAEWRRLQTQEPQEFHKAVQFEKDIQANKSASGNFASMPYLHRKRVPLDQIDFRSDVERGQMTLWDDECEGMCGL